MLPGEPDHRTAQKRSVEGIPVPDGVWEEIVTVADSLGVAVN